ncbi:MAG: hypothetical protein EOP48_01300 [Sphingobacteriales bacterium]|nr:MAG: hypothetical protein EOP48_01300 [Sphingobacteriales bacterium]
MTAIQVSDSRILLLSSNPDSNVGRVLNGTKKSRCKYTIPGLLQRDANSTTHLTIKLLHCEIPHSIFVFTSVNNLLRITSGLVTYDVEIEEGNYDGSSLINFLQVWFDANASSLNMPITLSSSTGKLTFAATSSFSISDESTCSKQLGFDLAIPSSYDSLLSKHVITCPYLMDLSGLKAIHIRCPSLSLSSFNSLSRVTDVLQSIQVNVPPFGLIMFNKLTQGGDLVIKGISQSNETEILLVDGSTGLELDFQNLDWLLNIQITKHQYIQSNPTYFAEQEVDLGNDSF